MPGKTSDMNTRIKCLTRAVWLLSVLYGEIYTTYYENKNHLNLAIISSRLPESQIMKFVELSIRSYGELRLEIPIDGYFNTETVIEESIHKMLL